MQSLKDVPREDVLTHGHGACPGCGYASTAKNIAKSLAPIRPCTFCLMSRRLWCTVPNMLMERPISFHRLREHRGGISGIKAALQEEGDHLPGRGDGRGRRYVRYRSPSIVRGSGEDEDVIFVCLDNEAFMNTGIQRSSATPFGAWTTTSPIGTKIEGNRRFKKDIGAIVAAHEVPYVANLSVAHFSDFVKKVQRAKEIKGFRFLHCLTPCIPGWRIEPSKGVSIDQLAVDTGMWTLYEIDHGKARR